MPANLTPADIARLPPDIQRQIMEELNPPKPPAPETPKEWYQVGGTRPAQPHATQPAPKGAEQPRRAPRTPRKPHKSYLWLYILVAYILLISACLLPGLLMKP
jgi:hypothetical protein